MEWLFVYENGGWWLKIGNTEQLTEYHKKTDGSRYEEALKMYTSGERPENMSLEERIKMAGNRDYQYMIGAIMQARNLKCSILDGFRAMNIEIGMAELNTIKECGAVYINKAGGHTFRVHETQFCRRKELIFPDFKIEDIRVKRFQGGCHWYAYIGDMQVRNGGELKWNTEAAARKAAESIVNC